jgi:hypothetical protein|nr:MAG TPA: hypothetical protein [Caudoviricetes sp.]
MKFEIYKAVDKIDGELSLFMFDCGGWYTVVPYGDHYLGQLVKDARFGDGCHWIDSANETPRREDMIDPVLICVVESE